MANKVDTALEIYDAVNNALILSGLGAETAQKYAYFASQLYHYIAERPELQTALKGAKATYQGAKGAKEYVALSRLAENAAQMNAVGFAEKFAARGKVSAGGAISAFVDYAVTIANGLHIEMNECAIAVTKVMLDVLSTIALAETLVGLWAASLQALAIGADTKEMIRVCAIPI